MPNRTEVELLDRIRELETENSALRDKLDLIYSIVAPADDEEEDESDNGNDAAGLVQIREVN